MRNLLSVLVLLSCGACGQDVETNLDLFDDAFVGYILGEHGGIGVTLVRSDVGHCPTLSPDVRGIFNGEAMEVFVGGATGPRVGFVGGSGDHPGVPAPVPSSCEPPSLAIVDPADNSGEVDVVVVEQGDQALVIEVAHLRDLSTGDHRMSLPDTNVNAGVELTLEIPGGFEPDSGSAASASWLTTEQVAEPRLDGRTLQVPTPLGAGSFDVEVQMLATPSLLRCDGHASCAVTELVQLVWSGTIVVE